MSAFFRDAPAESWTLALQGYPTVLEARKQEGLTSLDVRVWQEWPRLMEARTPPHVTRDELLACVDWKMKRGAWRGWNRAKVERNSDEEVVRVSSEAMARCPHPRLPLERLCALHGVGAATASAVLAAARPDVYAYLDEEVAAGVPGLGPAKFTVDYAVRYMDALRRKAEELGWPPNHVAQALWVVGALGL